jgi:hypothetical protein
VYPNTAEIGQLASALAALLALSLVIYVGWYRRALRLRAFLPLALLPAFITIAAVSAKVGILPQSQVSHLWLFGDKTLNVAGQMILGIVLGGIGGLFTSVFAYTLMDDGSDMDEFGLALGIFGLLWLCAIVAWLIVAIFATLFNWGAGFGYGWGLSVFVAIPLGFALVYGVILIFAPLRKAPAP